MATPFTLPTTGTDPKATSKEVLEVAVNAALDFKLNTEDAGGAAFVPTETFAPAAELDRATAAEGALADRLDSVGDNHAPAVGDQSGNVPLAQARDVTLMFVRDGTVYTPESIVAPMVGMKTVSGSVQAVVADILGQRVVSYSQNSVIAAQMNGPDAVRIAAGTGAPVQIGTARAGYQLPDDVWAHIPSIGQSLSVGFHDGGSVITSVAAVPDVLKMFNGGVLPHQSAPIASNNAVAINAAQITSLVGANEAAKGTANFETHITSMAWGFAVAAGATATSTVTASGHGFGSSSYADIGPATVPWNNMLAAVTAHKNLAVAAGATAYVPWISWIHGEEDQDDTQAAYLAKLDAVAAAAQTDIQAITGQTEPVYIVVSQCAPISSGALTEVAAAQLQFGRENAVGICAGPHYWADFSDNLHMQSAFYRQLGELHAKLGLSRLSGAPAFPLHMTGITRTGVRTLLLRFHVPVAPISLEFINVTGGHGLEVWQSAASRTILKVDVASDCELEITMSADLLAGDAEIRCGHQTTTPQGATAGPRSGIHDGEVTHGSITGVRSVNWASHQIITE